MEDKISKSIILPQKEPSSKKTTQKIVNQDIVESKKLTKIKGIIIPKSKPLVVKKEKTKIAKKSKFFSEKDFSIAKQAIQLMEKQNLFLPQYQLDVLLFLYF